MFRSFFYFVHQLSSNASLSLSELSSTAKFFKISLVQSSTFLPVGSLYQRGTSVLRVNHLHFTTPLCMLCLAVFGPIVYDDDHINYVATVLRSKLHIEEVEKNREI